MLHLSVLKEKSKFLYKYTLPSTMNYVYVTL